MSYIVRKVLITSDHGPGWSTRNAPEYAEDFLFDKDLIAAVEANQDLGDKNIPGTPLFDFVTRLVQKHGLAAQEVVLTGASNLIVKTITGKFRVSEYHGSESLILEGQDQWF